MYWEQPKLLRWTIFWEILHEYTHGFYNFFGLEDDTHKYLMEKIDGQQVTVEQAFPKIIKELKSVGFTNKEIKEFIKDLQK